MKNLILSSLMIILSFNMIAQITVSEVKTEYLYKSTDKNFTLIKASKEDVVQYGFYFRDAQYKSIVELKYISFSNVKDVKQFFNILADCINNTKEVTLTIGSENVSVKTFNKNTIMVFASGGYFMANIKMINEVIEKIL